jgi:2,4-dienoyl-CoA reductase-like NADH-dependent reductase (Old Yellow Enzyme family)
VTNRREDEWGGALENRARLLLEIVRATRRAVGDDFPVAVKLNSADFQKGGFDLPDCVRVAAGWPRRRSTCWRSPAAPTSSPGCSVTRAGRPPRPSRSAPARGVARRIFSSMRARFARPIPLPMMVTGGFRSRAAMAEALAAGELDVVGLGRPVCTEPDLPGRLAVGTSAGAAPPPSLRFGEARWAGRPAR